MDDKPRYWFGAKIGFFAYRPPLGWPGWVAVAVWMTVWLAAIPFMNSPDHPFLSLGSFSVGLQCCLEWRSGKASLDARAARAHAPAPPIAPRRATAA
jgi:hypothetical protein